MTGRHVEFTEPDDPAEAKRSLEMGVDTILTNGYQPVSFATGLK